MLSRIFSRLIILASVGILAGVTYYFMDAYRSLRERERTVQGLGTVGETEGPCAALAAARHVEGPLDPDLQYTLGSMRSSLATKIVGEDDVRGRRVLLRAFRDGLVDRGLCEQIRLARSVGEVHPVLALLRYTREGGNPCDEEPALAQVLDGLGSHRAVMLHAFMHDVSELHCLSPGLSEKIAGMVVDTLLESPRAMDDLDVLRVGAFVSEWAPLGAAQVGCRIESRGDVSALGNVLGCPPDARRRILVHYRVAHDIPASTEAAALTAGADVVLLRQMGPFCEIISASGAVVPRTVACKSLKLSSDLVVGVRVEALSYGRAQADLVAGLATYVGKDGAVVASTTEPELRSWFGYDRRGNLLGAAHKVELGAVAAMLGEAVPDEPLRAFCRKAGARYCYDVDWAHVVSRLEGEAVLFLSRPADVFLEPAPLTADEGASLFHQAFGREPSTGSSFGLYRFGKAGELVLEAERDDVELRWRLEPGAPWRAQELGRSEGGAMPPSARLLAALDIDRDGLPELVVQRITRGVAAGGPRDQSDEVLLLRLSRAGDTFGSLNRLTVHEY